MSAAGRLSANWRGDCASSAPGSPKTARQARPSTTVSNAGARSPASSMTGGTYACRTTPPNASCVPSRSGAQALAASPRVTGAPAEEEIDKPAGRFLQPCDDVACFELFTYLSRAIIRQSAKFDRGGDGQPAEPARVSGLSERHCSHWGPHSKSNEDEDGDSVPNRSSKTKLKISPF